MKSDLFKKANPVTDELDHISHWKDIQFEIMDEVSTSDFSVIVYITGVNLSDQEVDAEVELDVKVKAHEEDFGIGNYEFWGARGNDSQIGWEVDSLEITTPFPKSLKWLKDKIEDKLCDMITGLDASEPPYDDREPDW